MISLFKDPLQELDRWSYENQKMHHRVANINENMFLSST